MQLLFPYIILLIVLFQLLLKKNSKKDSQANKLFWDKESQANSVRRKDIDSLDYITIPDDFPTVKLDNASYNNAISNIDALRNHRILNLTGISNTDLKLSYGPANLALLTEYDDNFSALAKNLVAAAKALTDNGYKTEAARFLEFGIRCNTDITANYTMLAEYYLETGDTDKINTLLKTAKELNSLSRDVIISKLNSYLNNI